MLNSEAEALSPGRLRRLVQPCWNGWALAPLALAGASVAVPYLWGHGFVATALGLQQAFALVCHQRPERSFWLLGGTVAVCSRCLGIYAGAVLGLLLRTSHKLALQWLTAAVVLNAIDALCETTGLHGNWLGVRFLLGVLVGMTAALLVSSAIPTGVSHRAKMYRC